jgi:hypothetical protein
VVRGRDGQTDGGKRAYESETDKKRPRDRGERDGGTEIEMERETQREAERI